MASVTSVYGPSVTSGPPSAWRMVTAVCASWRAAPPWMASAASSPKRMWPSLRASASGVPGLTWDSSDPNSARYCIVAPFVAGGGRPFTPYDERARRPSTVLPRRFPTSAGDEDAELSWVTIGDSLTPGGYRRLG